MENREEEPGGGAPKVPGTSPAAEMRVSGSENLEWTKERRNSAPGAWRGTTPNLLPAESGRGPRKGTGSLWPSGLRGDFVECGHGLSPVAPQREEGRLGVGGPLLRETELSV